MKVIKDRVQRFWCESFHPAPMWPIHGQARCPACWRVYKVPWANGEGPAEPIEFHHRPVRVHWPVRKTVME